MDNWKGFFPWLSFLVCLLERAAVIVEEQHLLLKITVISLKVGRMHFSHQRFCMAHTTGLSRFIFASA